jgi:hypothetical protein
LPGGLPGIPLVMTDEQTRPDRHPTDEPDGTTAYAASLSPVGDSVRPGGTDTDPDELAGADTGVDFEDTDDATAPESAFDETVLPGESRAGYDVDDVAGDTEAVRPQ